MKNRSNSPGSGWLILLGLFVLAVPAAVAEPPVVKTVPWVASNPLIPHTTYSGKSITLKGTSNHYGPGTDWIWDFGDGSPVATGSVANPYAIEARHVYSGVAGTIFTARLTVQNTGTGEIASRTYFVQLTEKTIEAEVNVAIDEGLWYLHKTQHRWNSGTVTYGDWTGSGYAGSGYYGVSVANLNAFEVNGHTEFGSAENPYVETVARGMHRLFEWLGPAGLGLQNNGLGSGFNPDSNLNGMGVRVAQSYPFYQGGMFMDAIVASGNPGAIAVTGPAGIQGRTYAEIVQDMVDDYSWAQYDGSPGGGWRYNANDYPDNSACQWAAIGLIAAERSWGLTIPLWVKEWNIPWLKYSQAGNGQFGYTDTSPVWGPFATTPSGLVQMVLDGIGRDMTGPGWPSWNLSESFLRDRFAASGSAGVALKDYYYGLFSFVKSMLLHRTDTDGDGLLDPAPITMLRSITPGVPPIDWYAAEASAGAPTDGVARTLVNDQNDAGFWYGHNYTGDQYPFETAWAIMMLHRTLFESGAPVAVAKAIPNPGIAGQIIILDGSDSYHQDGSKSIASWLWDLGNDGVFEGSGPVFQAHFDTVGAYPVRLQVADDGSPEKSSETVLTVVISTPPLAPTADAGGPYTFCPSAIPWYLDGRGSQNPDEGKTQIGLPPSLGDTIKEYAWDLNGDGIFGDATGPIPEVTAYLAALGPGSHLVYLRVTDSTGTAYPDSELGDLIDISTAQVFVLADGDPACVCSTLSAVAKVKQVQLSWTTYPGAPTYAVYRSTTHDGPYTWIGESTTGQYLDSPGVLNRVYYFIVRPLAVNGDELCQSNEIAAEPLHPTPVVTVSPANKSNLGRYYYQLRGTSQSFGRMQLLLYVADTATSFVVGPIPNESIVYVRTHMPSAGSRAGPAGVAGIITVKGSARVWAQDPIGQLSAETVIP